MVEQIALATKTITAENTPEKRRTDKLSIHPVWKYRGPACTIDFEWSVGQWKLGAYDHITDEYHATINQVESREWQEFEPLAMLPSIPLDKVSPRDEPYVAEMWFRGPFPDLCVRVNNCVKVVEEVLKFDVMPTASPTEVAPGEEVTITCRITSRCTRVVDGHMECLVREGSIYGPPGDILDTYTSDPFTISPGQTKTFTFRRTAVKGTIDRRDIGIVVFVDDQKATSEPKESWDDVYYVKEIELELLEVNFDPYGAGYVTVTPEPESGTQHNWYFPHGTTVYVTAHPYPGYVFESWSGEMTDTSAITAPVYPMTEKRTITAHFKKIIEEEIDFILAPPSVTPPTIIPGAFITIVCPITSACNTPQTIRARIIIYEGSWLPAHGSVITTKWSAPFTIAPGQTFNAIVNHYAVEGTIDRRDIEVEVYIVGEIVKEAEWDDVYYVAPGPPPPPPGYTLSATATAGGIVSPASVTVKEGETATITAYPNSGYVFDHWIREGLTSYSNPYRAIMYRDISIVAYFRGV